MENTIKIYNSLKREKELLGPIDPAQMKMYVCGPTVYDEPHIGHARSAYIFDVIRRYLVYKGYKVTFVRNVTDVDDKIIDRAKKEFPGEDLISAVKKVSSKYLDAYHNDMKSLGIMDPDVEPKATEFLSGNNPSMQKFITSLVERGVAYVAGSDVYFDIKKAKNYGKLSNQSIDKMEPGARVLPGENKKDPLDFALWKAAKEGEPSWDSPWGKGRPGWHIECSVMSSDILGDKFDIHGGGIDLIFPHHENEIAQSEGLGKEFAKYWIHHGLLTINGQKMAKSLGNFVTIKNFLNKYKDADLLKLFYLSTHYSHPIDFTEEKIGEAKKALERIIILMDNPATQRPSDPATQRKEFLEIESIEEKFILAMDDDFNTPQALASIFDLVNLGNKNINDSDFVHKVQNTIRELLDIFGLSLKVNLALKEEIETDEEIRLQIKQRDEARKNKDFKLADKIRKELEEKGFIVEDSEKGTKIRRKL